MDRSSTYSISVLFRDYLRRDPTMIDRAQEVLSEALADAERAGGWAG